MPELSFLEVIKYAVKSLITSKVLILFILELIILLMAFVFRRLMDKNVVNKTSIIASLVVFGFYISNYVGTLMTFINNVSTKLIELLYFPTTLEFMIVVIISFIIMIVTLIRKKSHWLLKFINTSMAIVVSFLFLCIIEYINVNNIPFNEFSVFTNPILMSLYELTMGIFITWIIGLSVFKIDMIIINSINEVKEVKEEIEDPDLITVNIPVEDIVTDDDIELPRLKEN